MQDETKYILEPTAFHSMRDAQYLTDQLEESLSKLSNVAANIKPQVVEVFSEMVNNAAEHGMSDAGAHCHVRLMPHRRSLALDSVITDRGPGIRATLERNPNLQVESDEQALRLAVQELTSGTGNPTRGIGPLDRLPGMPEAPQETSGPLWHRPAHGLRYKLGGILDRPRTPGHHRTVHHPHLTSETRPPGQAALRRSPTMAGSSGARSSLLHNFHQGRGGGSSGGWKFQTASARKSRCSKNCASLALACLAMFVSRSYGSLPKNTTRSKNSPGPSSALVANRVSRSYASWSWPTSCSRSRHRLMSASSARPIGRNGSAQSTNPASPPPHRSIPA